MNHLEELDRLDCRYFVMRHGRSKANEQGLIVSHPDNGLLPDYGLAELGREQALRSAAAFGLTSRTLMVACS